MLDIGLGLKTKFFGLEGFGLGLVWSYQVSVYELQSYK